MNSRGTRSEQHGWKVAPSTPGQNAERPVDTVMQVLDLFETRYRDFTAKHFWDKLVSDHDFKRSYNWVRLTLQAHGLTHKAPRRGAHRLPAGDAGDT